MLVRLCFTLACVFQIAACSGPAPTSDPANAGERHAPPAAGAAAENDALAAIELRLAQLPWIAGSYMAGDNSSEFVAFVDDGAPVAIFEQQDFGDYGEARVAHYYDETGALIGFRKWARQLSSAGAPSDGWYESILTVRIADGRFVSGEKSVNGAPAEPDEHEVRGAGRTGAEMKTRVMAILNGDTPARQETPNRQLIVRGSLDAGAPAPLPEGAIARIQIRDVLRQDAAADVIASEDREVDHLPTDFAMAANGGLISKDAALSLFVQIIAGDELLFITAEQTPLDAAGGNNAVTAKLLKVGDFIRPDPAPGTGSGGNMITPPPVAFSCAAERLLISFEAGAAFVTFADKQSARLPLLPVNGDASARIYTNGRVTVLSRHSDGGAPVVEFARGRAAFAACVPL